MRGIDRDAHPSALWEARALSWPIPHRSTRSIGAPSNPPAQQDDWNQPLPECATLLSTEPSPRAVGDLQAKIKKLEKTIVARNKANEMSQRLATIPGVGIITATAMVATVVDAGSFKSGRHFELLPVRWTRS